MQPRSAVLPDCIILLFQPQQKWEALALSPGMWVHLRRLAITKNRQTGNMSARMKDKGSSINPLHPRMAEVQHIATAYANHCASVNSFGNAKTGGGGSGNSSNTSATSRARAPPAGGTPPRQAPAAAVPGGRQTSPPRGARASSDGGGGGGSSAASEPPGQEKTVANGEYGERENTPPRVASGLRDGGRAKLPSRLIPGSPSATVGWQRHPPTSPSAATAVPQSAAPRSERGGGGTKEEIAAPASGGGASNGGVGTNIRSLAERRGVIGDESARGTKRALPVVREGGGAGLAPGSGRLSNLGVVRSKTAPSVFDVRARVVSHWPSNVRGACRACFCR